MMFEVDKEYTRTDALKSPPVKILAILSDGRVIAERSLNAPFVVWDDGRWTEKREPIKHVRYYNMYPDSMQGPYSSRCRADEAASLCNRIGCIRVEFTEGQYDD